MVRDGPGSSDLSAQREKFRYVQRYSKWYVAMAYLPVRASFPLLTLSTYSFSVDRGSASFQVSVFIRKFHSEVSFLLETSPLSGRDLELVVHIESKEPKNASRIFLSY